MRRFRAQLVDGQRVELVHVRLWMLAVPVYPGFVGSARWWSYVDNYRVVPKIARAMAEGTFERIITEGFALRGQSFKEHRRLLKKGLGW